MAKKSIVPIGLKRLAKGGHSERNTSHKECFYCASVLDGQGKWVNGPKKACCFTPPSVPAHPIHHSEKHAKQSHHEAVKVRKAWEAKKNKSHE